MLPKNKSLLIISAPSGTGKTTVVRKLIQDNPNMVASISYTTRSKRDNEIDGDDYRFVSIPVFEAMAAEHAFFEYAEVFGNFYGTPKQEVEVLIEEGKTVILEIDWQGANQVRKTEPNCLTLFLIPPSKEELKKRLDKRGTDSVGEINLRFKEAINDIQHSINYDATFVNKDLELTCDEIINFVKQYKGLKKPISEHELSIINSFKI